MPAEADIALRSGLGLLGGRGLLGSSSLLGGSGLLGSSSLLGSSGLFRGSNLLGSCSLLGGGGLLGGSGLLESSSLLDLLDPSWLGSLGLLVRSRILVLLGRARLHLRSRLLVRSRLIGSSWLLGSGRLLGSSWLLGLGLLEGGHHNKNMSDRSRGRTMSTLAMSGMLYIFPHARRSSKAPSENQADKTAHYAELHAHLLQGSPELEGGLDLDQLAGSCKALELVGKHLLPARWQSLAMVIYGRVIRRSMRYTEH